MRVTIQDNVTPALAKKAASIKGSTRRMAALGKRAEVELHAHFDRKNAQGNSRGWWRSNFWSKIVKKATSFTGATATEATVSIASREFIHKLRGGVVTAKSGKKLAIPLRSEAKQKGSPREWDKDELIAVKTKRGLYLFRNLGFRGRGRTKGQRWEAYYKLVASVRHLADPTALPERSKLEAALADQLRRETNAEN